VLRAVLAVFYVALILAGLLGIGLSVWLVSVAKGVAWILPLILVPFSLFLIFTGSSLFRFVLRPPQEASGQHPSSSGWSELDAATARARHAGVAPHLRPEALARFGDAAESAD
jgi:hypothetical protein